MILDIALTVDLTASASFQCHYIIYM